MSFKFSDEVKAIKDMAAKFVQKEILPTVAESEKKHEFQRDLVRKMGELGFYGCPLPEEYGGSGLGFLAHAVVTEEIAKVSGSLRAPFNMQTMGTAREIFQYGNEEQKKKYIPGVLSGELLGCIGITEPNAGSDVGAARTKAVKKGRLLRNDRLEELDHLRPGCRRGDYLCLHEPRGEVQGPFRFHCGNEVAGHQDRT